MHQAICSRFKSYLRPGIDSLLAVAYADLKWLKLFNTAGFFAK